MEPPSRVAIAVGIGTVAAAVYLLARRRARRAARPPLLLFDVDGTLAVAGQKAEQPILDMFARLQARGCVVGMVGAGDFEKQQGQLGGPDLRDRLDFCFSENGVHAFRGRTLLHSKSIIDHLGEARWREFKEGLDALLARIRGEAETLLQQAAGPAARIAERGTFLEERKCTCNVTVIGRTPGLSKAERAAFDAADATDGLRKRVQAELLTKFGPGTPYSLNFAIGGQIGIDCAPVGWDKTFCLQFLDPEEFPTIHFFGDKTLPGGGDYELYEHPRTIGHAVKDAAHTLQLVESMFLQ